MQVLSPHAKLVVVFPFERFYQKDNAISGFGIGLALVKDLVELYEGTIKTKEEIEQRQDDIDKIKERYEKIKEQNRFLKERLFKAFPEIKKIISNRFNEKNDENK